MLGKLKEMAGSAATDKAVEKMLPLINEHLSACLRLGAPILQQDATYTSHVIEPAYLPATSSAGGATSLIPQFKERFARAFFIMRDELIDFSEQGVTLVPDFSEKLPAAVKRALAG